MLLIKSSIDCCCFTEAAISAICFIRRLRLRRRVNFQQSFQFALQTRKHYLPMFCYCRMYFLLFCLGLPYRELDFDGHSPIAHRLSPRASSNSTFQGTCLCLFIKIIDLNYGTFVCVARTTSDVCGAR